MLLQFAVENRKFTRQLLTIIKRKLSVREAFDVTEFINGVSLREYEVLTWIQRKEPLLLLFRPINYTSLWLTYRLFCQPSCTNYSITSYITVLPTVGLTAVQNLFYCELLKQAIIWLDKTCHT